MPFRLYEEWSSSTTMKQQKKVIWKQKLSTPNVIKDNVKVGKLVVVVKIFLGNYGSVLSVKTSIWYLSHPLANITK